eukprot:NODE_20917_length_776_cov_4.471495.p4 GENE.NODE_20917_length_776_cov_4.471495~~NODE_20917_length_776_cov_4.471495.p4  ORF type:complete len:56 (-),score=26.59 NODE_20917_length_776_cov_4.471495:91-258(-)
MEALCECPFLLAGAKARAVAELVAGCIDKSCVYVCLLFKKKKKKKKKKICVETVS